MILNPAFGPAEDLGTGEPADAGTPAVDPISV